MKITITPTLIALTALTAVSFASARLASPNPHLATLDGPLLYASLTLVYFVVSNLNLAKFKNIAAILIAIGLLTNLVYTIIQKPPLLPWGTSTAIALKTVKSSSTHMLLGYGHNNFVEAFTALKPLSFNQSPLWHLRFAASRNQPLHILTTLGLLGFLSYLGILLTAIVSIFKPKQRIINYPLSIINSIALLSAIAMQLLLPPSPITFSLFIILISL